MLKMSACGMLMMMLLGCRLSRATQPDTSCPRNSHQQISVPCPTVAGEEVAFSLYKDEQMIYNHTCNYPMNAPSCTIKMHTGMRLQGNNESITFVLSGVMATKHGVYKCRTARIFPPPYLALENALWILVPEEGHESPCCAPKIVEWVWILLVVLLGVYSITVTIIAAVHWVKMREIDSQNDYINTKPKPSKDHQRNRHRQNRIRHF